MEAKKSSEKNIATADAVLLYEFTIDRPATEVWPHILNQNAWVKTHHYESISGEADTEGELGELSTPDYNFPPYFRKVVKVVPYRQFTFKVFTAEGADYGGTIDGYKGFDGFRLIEFDGTTKVIFDGRVEFYSSHMAEEPLQEHVNSILQDAASRWKQYEQSLRELIDSSY